MILGIRHGEVHNPGNVLYGHLPGFGLSDLGHKQAAAAAESLQGAPISAVYCSPLQRAVETATPIARTAGVDLQVDDRLIEWGFFSPWAGLSWAEVELQAPWDDYMNNPGNLTGTESLDQAAERIISWVNDHRDDEGIVIGVSHMDPLKAVALKLCGRPWTDLWTFNVGHTTAVKLSPEPDGRPLDHDALAMIWR